MSTGEAVRKILEIIKTALFTLSAVFLTCFVAWASGITVPSGARLNVDSGELHIETDNAPGSIRNQGVIRTTTGKIRLNGDWTIYDSGYYEAGSGTVIFSAAALATQIITPGTSAADAFFDLRHEGAGDLRLSTNTLKVRGDISNIDGTLYGQGIDMQIYGKWINTATVAPGDPSFVHGNNTVYLVGDDQELQGETIFYDLEKHLTAAPGRQLVLPSGLEQTVEHRLMLRGYNASNLLALRKSAGVDQAKLKLAVTGAQDIRFVDVYDNQASGRMLIGRQSPDKNNPVRDNTTNWMFGIITVRWDGAQDDNWNNPYNWNLGLVPEPEDIVIIPYDDEQAVPTPLPHQPVLRSHVTVASLEIKSNASLTLDRYNMTVNGALTNAGAVVLDGNEVVTASSLTDTGAFRYVGRSNGSDHDITANFIISGAPLTVFNALVINEAVPGANPDTFTIGADLTVTGDAVFTRGAVVVPAGRSLTVNGLTTVNGGAVDAQAASMHLNDFVLSSGSFSTPGGALPFTVSGDFTRSGGTFSPNDGTVTLDGVDQTLYTAGAGVVFYGLSKQAVGADTLTFEAGNTFWVSHKLTLRGFDDATLLNINSSESGNAALLNLATGGIQDIRNVSVTDNNALGGLLLVGRGSSAGVSNYPHWQFGPVTLVWDGMPSPLSLSHTAWEEPSNWDLGIVPVPEDSVEIPATVDKPHLTVVSGAISLAALNLSDVDATLYLDGHGMTIAGSFQNDGTIYLTGAPLETLSFTQDIDSGTFVYRNDGTGNPYSLTFPDSFFNVQFQPSSSGTPSVFTQNIDMTIYGDMTIAGSSVDAGDHSIDLRGDFIMTGGAFKAPGFAHDFLITGDFTQVTASGFDANGGTVTFNATSSSGSTDQVIRGTTTFSGFSKRIPSGSETHQLTLDSAGEQIITRILDLGGIAGNLLQLASTTPGTMAKIQLKPGVLALQDISYMVVVDSNAYGTLPLPPDAGHAVTLVARYSTAALSSNYQNWKFGTAEVVWTGAVDTNWNDPRNWDLGVVPFNGTLGVDGDDVRIPNVTNKPYLVGPINLRNMMVEVDASVYLGGFDMTLTGALSNNGNVILQGRNGASLQHIAIAAPDTDHGTFTYTGDDSGLPIPIDIYDMAGTAYASRTYHNLVIADTGTTADTFVPGGGLDVKGALTVTRGTLNISNVPVVLEGAFLLNGGTVLAPNTQANAANTLTAKGDWNNASGTFTSNTGRVTFSGLNDVLVSGNTTFWDFNVVGPAAGRTVAFQPGSDQTIANTLNIAGDQVNKIILKADSPLEDPPDWMLTILSGTPIVNNVDVKDSTAVFPVTNFTLDKYILAFNSVDEMNGGISSNTNWVFATLQIVTPTDGRTVDTVPTIIGNGIPERPVTLIDMTGAVIATALADANGNFRVAVGHDDAGLGIAIKPAMDEGAGNRITPVYNGFEGNRSADITVVALNTTSADQVPLISAPLSGTRMNTPLPTITGFGKPGAHIGVVVSNPADGLLLTLPPKADYAAEGFVAMDGTFSLPLVEPLRSGHNYVSVVVDGVSSKILDYLLNNVKGTVFDSITNQVIRDAVVTLYNADGSPAVPGTDVAATDVNPYHTGSDGKYFFLTVTGPFYFKVEALGYDHPTKLPNDQLPVGRSIVTGSRAEIFMPDGIVVIDHPMDSNPATFKVEKKANKSEARVGEVVTYTVTIESLLESNSIQGAKLVDIIPPGFKYMNGRAQLDGVPMAEPEGNRPLWFNTGDFAARQKKTVRYQLVIGSGVVPGGYENLATMRFSNNTVLSNRATATVNVIQDPLFDAGTVFGKIFYDWNENGKQDNPEYLAEDRMQIIEGPVPNVKLVMEDGTLVTADTNGQYSIPALLPGRHLVRLDERSLPPGAYLTTDKVQVVDVTPGSVIKVNFGVNMDNTEIVGKDAMFFQKEFAVEQAVTPSKPRLNVNVFNDKVLLHNNTVIEQIEFRLFTNYAPFLMSWQLDIVDTDTKKLVRSFKGTRQNIYDPIFWDGRDASGKYLRSDFHYAYVLKVQDAAGKWDETRELALSLKMMTDAEMTERQRQRSDKEKIDEANARAKKYRAFLTVLAQGNVLKTQNIWVKGDTIILKATAADTRQVRVLKNGELFTEIPALERNGLTARELFGGGAEAQALPMEVILPDGDYELEVVSAQEAGDDEAVVLGKAMGVDPVGTVVEPVATRTARYKKPLKVGQDYMMFVAMGDGKAGYNMNKGNIEPVQNNDTYRRGFYTDGKLAYYLKGKIKGKYVVTSSFDTERQTKAAMRTFRDADYYPVYGDASTVNYDATNTEGPLYLAVDWDRSQAIWGNYAVAFNDVEFAKYTRSLYGGKLDYKTVGTTDHGDPKTNVVVFHAEVRQRSAHNEFLGTGGSLYYFKHQDIVQATDKIRLEVRDAVTGLVKTTTEMKEGVDYDVDYSNGRVLFWRPVSMLVGNDRLISNAVLGGDPIYVVSDYEYFVKDKIVEGTQGVRVAQAVGQDVVVGGTYVSETQANRNYQLTGQDVTAHLGKDANVQVEYAETTSDAQNNFISTDGGITFTELSSADNAKGRAYGIKQDARLFDRVGLKSYYKWIGDGFSTGSTTSQQGKELKGMAMTFDVTPVTRLTVSRDIQRLIDRGNLQTAMQVGSQETTTTLVQLVHDARRLRLTEEFQSVEVKGDSGVTTQKTNALTAAAQAEYALNEKTDISLRHEASLSGTSKQTTTVGVERQLTDRLSMIVEEALSSEGTATKIGATANVTPKLALSTDFILAQTKAGETAQTIVLGGRGQINDSTSLEATAGVTQTGMGVDEQTAALGLTSKVDDNTDVRLGVESTGAADTTKARQALVLAGTKTGTQGRETTAGVKIEDRPVEGQTTIITAGEKGQISPGLQLASERSFGFGANGQESGDTYKLARTKDGRNVETSYTRKFADTQTQHTDSNIFALSGDVNDRIALWGSIEKGQAMNVDGSIYDRTAIAAAMGYVEKDKETGKVVLQSSTKAEVRLDKGAPDKQQYVFYQSAEGKLNEQTTIKGKFSYSLTKNMDTGKAEAGYKEIMLGGAYRPVAMDRVNLFGEYTYKENQGPTGQVVASDVESTKMHVLSVGAAYELSDKWELVEKLAMRIMEEKVTGFDFAKTHTWLLVNRANYRINQDWKVGAEYRILTVKEAKDQKRGLLVEAVRSVNDNVELGIGYNFTNFVDDLTNLSYTVQGPFIRMTGKLYDQSPEERARSRAKWLEHRVAIYAQRMMRKEVEDPNSKIMSDLNRMYQTAKAAQQHGKYEESRQIYKNIITITQMMYEEAAQFVRRHIAYEENIYNAYQRAQEYYDKGELWQARKLWEKIVEEASKAVLE